MKQTLDLKTLEGLDIELNEKFLESLSLMENGSKNIFITGRAGTGKSTLLDCFRKITKKKIAVLAPTGVAALNVNGQTIHSFFGFQPDITLSSVKYLPNQKMYGLIDAIIIDEISMVRADLLDCIDKFLRFNGKDENKPFGGVQMIFIGDLYQLPPIVKGKENEIFQTHYKSRYFFDSKVFDKISLEFIELEKIYRQKDQKFIDLLNAVRNRSVTEEDIEEINKRVNSSFEPPKDDFYINLTTTNDLSNMINEKELSKLDAKLFSFEGEIRGKFEKTSIPTEINLKIKIGSQVMLLNNDSSHRWVNGTIGKVIDIKKEKKEELIVLELLNGDKVNVSKYTWDIYKLYYDAKKQSLDSDIIGSFTQYPLRLAWAVTIHKGQGKTFDKVIIDIGHGTFAHGQVYVALSRCTSLNGIVLKKPIRKDHIFMDWKIVDFLTKYQYKLSNKKFSLEDKTELIKKAIKNKSKLNITYLKTNDTKTKRMISPKRIDKMEYQGKEYLGLEAYCHLRDDERVFRVDRILEIEEAK